MSLHARASQTTAVELRALLLLSAMGFVGRHWNSGTSAQRFALTSVGSIQLTPNPNLLPANRRIPNPPQNKARCGTRLRYSPPKPSTNRVPPASQNPQICRNFLRWSQPGSNRRPPACKAGALPAELWPRRSQYTRYRADLVAGPQRLAASILAVMIRSRPSAETSTTA